VRKLSSSACVDREPDTIDPDTPLRHWPRPDSVDAVEMVVV
jgi:hypothetical protein